MKIRRLLMLVLSALMMVQMQAICSFAQNVPIVQDNGTGNQYDTLPVNYVQIKNLNFDRASIESGQGYSIKKGYVGSSDFERYNLIWTGKFKFGTGNTTNDSNAVLAANTLPNVTLRFPDGAELSDGTKADVLMTLSEVKVNLGKSRTTKITNNTNLQIVIAGGWGILSSMPPRTTYNVKNGTADNGYNSGASIGSKYKVTMQVVNKGTSTTVSSEDYPSMLVEFKDLDICDRTIKKSAAAATQGNGPYAEGIELVSGWIGSAVLAPTTNDLANTLLVNHVVTNGNTRIKVDGAKISSFESTFNPPDCDYTTLWSGFIAAAKPQGFSFYWTGSHAGSQSGHDGMGTTIGGQPTVAVKAKRINPGAANAVLGGTGVKSGVDTWVSNTHLMNSSYTYQYAPAEGWYIKSLKVDGAEQTLSEQQKEEGGSYTFERLNKYPLAQRNIRNGQVLIAKESGYYTIETDYGRLPDYTITKTSDTELASPDTDPEITYTIRAEEIYEEADAGTYEIHDDMAGGLLTLSGEPQVTVTGGTYVRNKADNTGLDYTFKSNAAAGTKPSIVIKYKARINWDAFYESGAASVINTCNDKTTEIEILGNFRIRKNVTGSLGDLTKRFHFTLTLTGLDPDVYYSVENSGAELTEGFTELPDVVLKSPVRPQLKSEPASGILGEGEPDLNDADSTEVNKEPNGNLNDEAQNTDNNDERSVTKNEDESYIAYFLADSDGNAVLEFTLRDEDSLNFLDLPPHAVVSVTEEESDHFPSYSITSGAGTVVKEDSVMRHSDLSTGNVELSTMGGSGLITFTNSRNIAPVTGIVGKTITGALLSLLAAAGMLAGVTLFRKRREEE